MTTKKTAKKKAAKKTPRRGQISPKKMAPPPPLSNDEKFKAIQADVDDYELEVKKDNLDNAKVLKDKIRAGVQNVRLRKIQDITEAHKLHGMFIGKSEDEDNKTAPPIIIKMYGDGSKVKVGDE